MRKFLLPAFGLLASFLTAQAQTPYFFPTNLVLVQQSTASSLGEPVALVQMQTNGTIVNTTNLPSSGPNAFVLSTSTTEGFVTLSANSAYLVLGGYNTTPLGTVSPASATSTNVPRAVVTLDAFGNFAMPIANSNIYSTFNIRGAVSDGLGNFWTSGNGGTGATIANGELGIAYVGTATAPTNVTVAETGTGNERCLEIYNGNLYLSTGSSTHGVFLISNVNGTYPETTVSAANVGVSNILTQGTATGPYAFQINAAGTVAYLAEENLGGIENYTAVNGVWTSNYTISVITPGAGASFTNAYGCAVDWSQSPPVIYATTSETSTNRLVRIVDNGPSSTATLVATAPAATAWRGVRFGPVAYPQITSQPVSVVTSANGTATFSVGAVGTGALSYQWYTNGTAVSGATSSSFSLSLVTTFQSGTTVYVVVSNTPSGTATSSNATLIVNPVYFTAGNLAVVSIGGPNQYLTTSDSGNTVFVNQYTTSGSLVSSYAIPSTGPEALVLNSQPYEGLLSLTPDNRHLVLAGFNTSAPYMSNGAAANVAFSYSATVPRAIVTIDGYGNYAMPVANSTIFNTFTIASAASDGSNYWALGTGATSNAITSSLNGLVYCGTATAPATVEVATGLFGSGRGLNIYNNGLYAVGYPINTNISLQSGAFLMSNISGALPTNSTGFSLPFPSGPEATDTPFDFVMNAAGTIAYVGDSTAGIVKFTGSGGVWVSNYTIIPTNAGYATAAGSSHVISVTADFSQTPPVIYATTDETITNRLVMIQDTGATPTIVNLAFASLSASGTNTLRGVRFVPGVPPTITNQPASLTQAGGGSATFTVGASGTPVLSYQWYTNSVAVAGATTSSFTLTSLTTNQTGTTNYVVVSNSYGTVSSANAILTVLPPGAPFNVGISPVSQTVSAGSSAAFTASGVGTAPAFIWALNGTALVNGGSVSGQGTATLTISPAYASYNGTYSVLASNSFGTSPGTNTATLTVIDPVILVQPVGSTNLPGGSSSLSVTAAGSPPLKYQWLSNSVAVAGATSSALTLANSGATVSAAYSVIVSNALGNSVTSAVTGVSFSPLILFDTFPYPNGNLFTESPWTDINGSNPELVISNRVQISQTNATTDAQRRFSTNVSGTTVWASFTLNVTNLPVNSGGVYFANFEDTNFGFYGRLFLLTSNKASLTPNMPNVAYPGTYRLGIANAYNDYASNSTSGPTAVVELDMAPGINYQVVAFYSMGNYSQVAVNPSPSEYNQVTGFNPSSLTSGFASDGFTASGLPMAAYGLRQRNGGGTMYLSNLEVSYDWNGAGSGFSAVTAGVTPAKAAIGLLTPGITNYSGNPGLLEVAASGIDLTYAWYQNGTALSDGADGGTISGSSTAALSISSLSAANAGSYTVVISDAAGSVTSSIVPVSVNTTPTAPTFTLQPLSSTNPEGSTVTFTATAVGTGPITYAWNFDGTPNGASGSSFTIAGVSTNAAGTYSVTATGGTSLTSTSSNAILTVTAPIFTNIGYLRSLMSPTTFTPSDTTTLFSIKGVCTVATNLTSGNTASFYVQDATGGINLFITGDSTFRPGIGEILTATGVLSSFGDNLEIDVTVGANFQAYADTGVNTNLPTPQLLTWATAVVNPTSTVQTIEGSWLYMTNVYFETNATTNGLFANGTTGYAITNNGQTFSVFVSAQDTNFDGQKIPSGPCTVYGVLQQTSATAYSLIVSRYADIVPNPVSTLPPAVTNLTAAISGTNIVLKWTAVPSNSTYSVWSATNLLGPWVDIAPGLTFSTASASYTNVVSNSVSARFFQVDSP